MSVKVAVVPIQANYNQALFQAIELVGGIDPLNTPAREVTIKIGLFDPRLHHHVCIDTLQAIISAFDQAPHIYLSESDNYCGKALSRLERFNPLCNDRVTLQSLSEDPETKTLSVAGGEMPFSHVLFKPHVLVSAHVLRSFDMGSVLKNLFGCTPVVQKGKFHKTEIYANQIADIFEACGGIDLAVMDGTYLFHASSEKQIPMNLLIAGRDAVAVETVGATLAGLKPEKMPILQEFAKRGLGETDMQKIEILGVPPEEFARLGKAYKELKKVVAAAPKHPGISSTIDQLVKEGWFDTDRTAREVVDELQRRGVTNATKGMVNTTLKRRVGKTLERAKENGSFVFRRVKK